MQVPALTAGSGPAILACASVLCFRKSRRPLQQLQHAHSSMAGTQRSCQQVRGTHLSQVLVPSPQGDLRVVMCSTLVGMRTGPFTLRRLSLAPLIRSAHTAGRGGTVCAS